MILKPVLKSRFNLYFSSLLAIFIIILMAYFSTIYIEKNIESKILEISTNDVFEITNNTANEIKKIVLDNKEDLDLLLNEQKINKNEKSLFNLLDKKVALLKTNNIKYAYILYVDKNEIFRFISDAARGEEKAEINQKFDIDSKYWIEAYKTKSPKVIRHDYLNELSLTYLKPIEIEDITLILSIDFSVKKIDEISTTISQVKLFLQLFWVLILILLVILIYQTFKFYKTKKISYIDRLTGIYSRNYLQDNEMFINLNDYIVCAIDVDYFKKVNDTYGHVVGDDILVQISNRIKNEIREKKDIFVRYGGEEFCLLIKKEKRFDPLELVEKIHNAIKNREFIISNSERIPLSVSIGVNLNPKRQRNFISAFKLADMALYNAKNKGRNSIEIYKEDHKDKDFLTINDIKDAIEDKRVVVYYQEIINEDENDKKRYYEALIRIIKDGQIYSPGKFLPTIKDTFISTKLTKELLSIIQTKIVNSQENIQISINLTQQDLQNEPILNILKEFAKTSNIASKIALEIVETDEIISYEEITKTIMELKKLSYKIYIDDFGSGYSNFIYLSKINADAIKIDGSIISTINNDELSYLVAKNIMNFAKEADIDVIAEYVSSKEIYETVKSLGIKKFQGYYFSEPI